MKTFNLTDKQRNMLLEMCKALFSEYKHISFDTQFLDIGSPLGPTINEFRVSNHVFFSKTSVPHDDGVFIHWYLLCMTDLVRKIGNSGKLPEHNIIHGYDASNLLADMIFKQEWIKNYHPVDYLYNKFKELK